MAAEIQQYNPAQYNILVPTQDVQQVSPWHAARTAIVVVSPDPMSGDVFDVGERYNPATNAKEKLYSPAKPALMRIAAAAGIVWNWRESGPVSLTRDYVCYKAVGAVRLPDGSRQPVMAVKEIDLTVIEEELREANLKKANEYAHDPKKQSWLKGMTPDLYAQAQTKTGMIQWRKNKLMRAETGAMLRVIRAALGMKSQYTAAELGKPFIVPRIDFSPDYSDPEVRRALIDSGVSAMAQLFSGSSPASANGSLGALRPAIEAPNDSDDQYIEIPQGGFPDPSEGEGQPCAVQMPVANVEPQSAPAVSPSTGEPQPAVVSPRPFPEAEAGPEAACSKCGAVVTDKVRKYSQSKFGAVLCYPCQNGGGQS
jgi:hypothetical protein